MIEQRTMIEQMSREIARRLSNSEGILWVAVRDGMGRDLRVLDERVLAGEIKPSEILAALDRFGPADVGRWLRDPAAPRSYPKHLVKFVNPVAARLLRTMNVNGALYDRLRRRLEAELERDPSRSPVDAVLRGVGLADLARWICEAYPEAAA